MPGVFISYRRSDSGGYAGRLFDILSAHFGKENIFMDLDTIEGGDNFSAVIDQKIGASDVLVAVIGSQWVTIADQHGSRRLDNPQDFVRLEIGKALARGIRVIPVLVGGASLPHKEDLPNDLRPLCDHQAVEIRDAYFHSDAEHLAETLHKAVHGTGLDREAIQKRWVPALLVGLAVLVILLGVLLFRSKGPAGSSQASEQKAAVAPPADIAGTWNATVKYDWGDSYPEVFDFEVTNNEVSGTASFLKTDRGILDGRITGNQISFTTKSLSSLDSGERTSEDKHYYKGTVDNGAIRFTMITDSGIESHVPIHFVANRVNAK